MSTSQKQKPKPSSGAFSEISYHDMVAYLMNTAVEAKDSGHAVRVQNATANGQASVVIVMPGYRFVDGKLQKAQIEAGMVTK